MQAINIRHCVPGDEIALSVIGQATFLDAFAGVLSGKDIIGHCLRQHSREKYAAWLHDSESAVWIAEIEPGQAPVGYLVLTKPDLPLADITSSDAEVKRVYLLNRFRGAGLGRRLMWEAERFATSRGVRRLLVGVYSRNDAAISFYEKLGYRRVGERSFTVGDGTYHDYILALALGKQAELFQGSSSTSTSNPG
jgi:ribosomal protein S18 acetylase RimI-like enzyme